PCGDKRFQTRGELIPLQTFRPPTLRKSQGPLGMARNTASDIQHQSAPASSLLDADASSGCNIKGNISDRGERIYHVPGQQYYDRTTINESKGERWFCTEAEA